MNTAAQIATILVGALAAISASVWLLRRHPTTRSAIGRLKAFGDPWSSLGPNTKTYAVGVGGSAQTIPAYYMRKGIRLSLDTATNTNVVYGLLNPGNGSGQNGTASSTNFHFALSTTQPPLELEYSGAIQLVANSGTIQVGAVEY